MKIVVDTNVVASAIFFGGKPRELLEMLVSKKLEAYAYNFFDRMIGLTR